MDNNSIIQSLPTHLKGFVIDQNYGRYTPQDQAVWRFVMRQNIHFLKKVAHHSYIEGLKKTGISADHIPSIEEMNSALGKLGWAAVTVDGFIPPSVFMEFQKHKVLVIAADIRPVDQIGYTPAPDIIHEAAGHAPIIADEEYAEYLRYFGEIGSKAFSSEKDYEMYEVIRHLSILKADPATSPHEVAAAEKLLRETGLNMGMPSEMALIRNLHWWTVEYGLFGDLNAPLIYGAGLLSSIAESKSALGSGVQKIPYTIDAMDFNFDITKPQPQLFVTPDFGHLIEVLEEFANQMALRTGGLEAIMKAIHSGNTATLVYASGLQVSGTFTDVIIHKGQAAYLNTTGPTALNYNDKMLPDHGKDVHEQGFGSPIGKLKACLKPLRLLTDNDLERTGVSKGRHSLLEFESGVKVEGTLLNITRKDGKIILMSFSDCKVSLEGKTLFEPQWGKYDMAVGEKIISAFNGPADPEGFGLKFDPPAEKTHQLEYDAKTKTLHQLYEFVGNGKGNTTETYIKAWKKFREGEFNDWLFPFELLIRVHKKDDLLTREILDYLEKIKTEDAGLDTIINNGIIYAKAM